MPSTTGQNYLNYWHFKGQTSPASPSVPSQPAAPAVTTRTNTRTDSVDPVNPSDWQSVVPSKLSAPPSQTASVRWFGFSPGVGDTMITGQMKADCSTRGPTLHVNSERQEIPHSRGIWVS